MCRRPPIHRLDTKTTTTTQSPFRFLANVVMAGYILGFCTFRVTEIYCLFGAYPIEGATSVLATFFLLKWSKLPWHAIAMIAMAAFVYISDYYILDPIPSLGAYMETVVVITGANSGLGFETSKMLAEGSSNITVVMACRSMKKCIDAGNRINSDKKNVVPLHLDLADFDSVYKFAESVQQSVGRKVDVLFNNAGYTPPNVEPINNYGLDPSFTSMHISHHLLTELLVKENPSLRVVATSSGTHHFCAWTSILPKALWLYPPGCIDDDYLATGIHSPVYAYKYITSKVANVMHTSEIPRRHPSSTAISIDLGWVGTSIVSFMSGNITPTSLGWMRSAKIGIYPVLQAILQPLAYFDEGRDWSKKGGLLIDPLGSTYEPFSLWWWIGSVNKVRMEEMGSRLWDKTTSILKEHGCSI
jgi:NAD(P)-dependent dehydrogenase (short-subunit alcohol dehydrogenase family)